MIFRYLLTVKNLSQSDSPEQPLVGEVPSQSLDAKMAPTGTGKTFPGVPRCFGVDSCHLEVCQKMGFNTGIYNVII